MQISVSCFLLVMSRLHSRQERKKKYRVILQSSFLRFPTPPFTPSKHASNLRSSDSPIVVPSSVHLVPEVGRHKRVRVVKLTNSPTPISQSLRISAQAHSSNHHQASTSTSSDASSMQYVFFLQLTDHKMLHPDPVSFVHIAKILKYGGKGGRSVKHWTNHRKGKNRNKGNKARWSSRKGTPPAQQTVMQNCWRVIFAWSSITFASVVRAELRMFQSEWYVGERKKEKKGGISRQGDTTPL